MKSFFLKHNKKILLTASSLVLIAVFFIPFKAVLAEGEVVAQIQSAILQVIGWVITPIVSLLGKIVVLLMNLLIWVAQYNKFIESSAVTYGWIVVRDLCNMFFVLILLVIAFATILRVESYNLKTWLPKLVIMAILINFSKMICGVFIDFAQVIMLTFVNAFKDIAGANMTEMLGITKILDFDPADSGEADLMSVIGALILALVMIIVSAVVVIIMLFMLVVRMVMIWIYVVLSPLAYLLASFPQGQSYSQKWWSDFSKNLIIGPILAFFIWLSFASLGGTAGSAEISAMKKNTFSDAEEVGNATITQAGSPEHMLKFIISIAMLIGGVMIAQEMGGAAGKVAGKGMAKLQAMGSGAIKLGKRATGIERAENAIKARQSMKETKRSELAQRDAGALNKAIGKTKKAVAYVPNKIGQGIGEFAKGSKMFGNISQKNIDETRKGIERNESQKVQLEDLKVKIEDAKSRSAEIQQKKGDELDAVYNDSTLSTSDMRLKIQEVQDKYKPEEDIQKERENELVSQYQNITGSTAIDTFAGVDTNIEGDIDNLGEQIEKGGEALADKMKKVKILDKTVSIVGNVATLGGKNKVKHAGEKDLDLASNHNSGQISKYKDGMKEDTDDDVRKKMNDYSKPLNNHERIAAVMTLMERGELSSDEAAIKRDEIKKSYGNDNKVMNQLDSALAGNYQNLSQSFVDLRETAEPPKDKNGVVKAEKPEEKRDREEKHEKTKESLARGVISGTIKLENINDQGSLDLIIPKLADIMTAGGFNSIHDKQTASQKNKIEIALKNAPSTPEYVNARIKLAGIKKNLDPLGNNAEKEQYLSKIGENQMKDLTSSIKGLESLKKFFEETGKLERFRGLIRDNKMDEFRSEMNSITRNMQFSSANTVHTGMLVAISNRLKSM
ncbi:MAG TPA: hypothetical protein PK142_01565 [bacterium]|nr:hypothetical protein [bacterium]